MELDPKIARKMCEAGFPESKIAPIKITHDEKYSTLDPYEYIYGKYTTKLPQDLYRKSTNASDPFKRSTRLKLIYYMIQASSSEGGLNYPIERMLKRNKILSFYPMHDKNSLEILTTNWLNPWTYPWKQPMNHIKEYFGEKIALYFSFMGTYTMALIIPAIFGIVAQLIVWSTDNWSRKSFFFVYSPNFYVYFSFFNIFLDPVIPFYSLFISLWYFPSFSFISLSFLFFSLFFILIFIFIF